MASYPGAVKVFSTKVFDDDILASHVNDLQDEVSAIEDALLNGVTHDISFTGLLTANKVNLGLSTATIAAGIITVTGSQYIVDTEGGAASDDLDTITAGAGVTFGHLLLLRQTNPAHAVVLKHLTGNLKLSGGDFNLSGGVGTCLLFYDGTFWLEVGR